MSDFKINAHELLYLEDKRKSKTNSFYIFKFNKENTINLTDKKINISKKNNHIDVSSTDKKILSSMNNSIKENLENYINENEIDIKSNLTKIVFNDIVNNNKILFDISEVIDKSLIDKSTKYNCVLQIKYIILVFTGQKSCEASTKITLSSIKSNYINSDNNDDNDEELSSVKNSSISDVTMKDNSENLNLNENENENKKKTKINKNNKSKKKIISVDTNNNNEENIENTKVKKRGRPRVNRN